MKNLEKIGSSYSNLQIEDIMKDLEIVARNIEIYRRTGEVNKISRVLGTPGLD